MKLNSDVVLLFSVVTLGICGVAFNGFDSDNSSMGRSRSNIHLDSTPRCYNFESDQTPENLPANELATIHSTWCYQDVETESGIAQLVFNAENEKIQLEDAALVYPEGDLVHGSLLKGKVSVHRTHADFINPLPVPLRESELRETETINFVSPRTFSSLEQVKSVVTQLNQNPARVIHRNIIEGTMSSMLPDASLPYGAYWWPHKGLPLSNGPDSPLGKYDRYVLSRTGTDPKSREWETKYHSLQHVEWGGHCNGWAASSVLHKEITERRWDEKNKMIILNSDINGMYAEASFCVNWAFYGKRNNGAAGDDPKDISPDRFHKVLLYYIDQLKKPIAMDYYPEENVDNNVIGGYEMKISKGSTPDTFVVTTTLKAFDYDHYKLETVGVANRRDFTYKYRLKTDSNGEIVSGEWISSSNPDFLWVPLSQKKCGRENPYIDHKRIEEIVNLPVLPIKTIPKNIVNEITIPKNSSVEVFKISPLQKEEIKLSVNFKTYGHSYVQLEFGPNSDYYSLKSGAQVIPYEESDPIEKFYLRNTSHFEDVKVKIELNSISYLDI